MKNKKVFISLTAESIHHGHIKLIDEGKKYGDIVIGLLTDNAVAKHKRLPLLNFDQRKTIIENISGVSEVIAQDEWDDSIIIEKLRPEYVIHGDDWLSGPQLRLRDNVIKTLNKYNGKLIELPYTKGISSEAISNHSNEMGISPELRLKNLKRCISTKKLSRFIETHSPISALIAEKAKQEINGKVNYFDGFWSSSLTDSSLMGKPDIEVLDISQRLDNINNIFEVTTKPLIMDIDTGGKIEHLKINVRTMERLGISAMIMEDKTGLKKNSLHEDTSNQQQEDIEIFSEKIKSVKLYQSNSDFMVIARIESFILKKGIEDALKRAKSYVGAGADAIMIHSKSKTPDEIFSFSKKFRLEFPDIPLVCVPSSYSVVKESELIENGFNVVIYANQLFRAAYPAMVKTANSILINERAEEIEKELTSIKDMMDLIPGTK
jgi:phosphoenolpyruvate phosphomutase / 2-hydroxyethylphosphonate cytidylyltransferase